MRYFVERGSVYSPGWHVYEQVRDNYLVSRGCFDEKPDADDFLDYLRAGEQ